jgi:hypothetical protein
MRIYTCTVAESTFSAEHQARIGPVGHDSRGHESR